MPDDGEDIVGFGRPIKTDPLDIPLTKDEQNTNIIDFFATCAEYITIEKDFESELGEHVKVVVRSEFFDDPEKTFLGQNLHECLIRAAETWHKQCVQQAQMLEATLKKMRAWCPIKGTIYDGRKS